MKIQVCQADFDTNKIDKISRLVSKTAQSEKIGLSKAKEILSICLGYADYHDLHKSVCQNEPKFGGSPRQLNRSITENVESSFSAGEANWIFRALESWGIDRLAIYSVKSPSMVSSQLLDEISVRLSHHLGTQLPRRLWAMSCATHANSSASDGETILQVLSTCLPPLIVVKDIAHTEINDFAPPGFSVNFFELDSYRMLIKKGAVESDITEFMGLTQAQLEYLQAASKEFDAQLNITVPAFLRRYGMSPRQITDSPHIPF